MDEHLDAVGTIPQDVVAAAAHDDTGPRVGQLPDDLGLRKEGLMVHRGAMSGERVDSRSDGSGGEMKAAACPLLRPGDEIGGKAAFFRRFADEGAVVAGDAQSGGQLLADQPAAAAKLPADGDNIVRHTKPSFRGAAAGARGGRGAFPAASIIARRTGADNGNLDGRMEKKEPSDGWARTCLAYFGGSGYDSGMNSRERLARG